MEDRLAASEKIAKEQGVTITKLTAEIAALKKEDAPWNKKCSASVQPRYSDPAFKQLAFVKIPNAVSECERIKVIEKFFSDNFPDVRVRDIQNVYTGPFPDGRTLSRTTLVEFSNSDVRRIVLEQIATKESNCCIGG